MKTITKQLIEESNGLLIFGLEDTNANYGKFNNGSVECEVGEFLYGMVRILKPKRILETGTHLGVSAAYMGKALDTNGFGKLETIEFLDHLYMQSQRLFKTLQIDEYIQGKLMNIDQYEPSDFFDILFLDSEPERRWKELERFYEYLRPGGYAFLHDLPRGFCIGNINPDHPQYKNWPWGEMPQKIQDLIKDRELIPFHFPNPREMCGFYKQHPGDYHV